MIAEFFHFFNGLAEKKGLFPAKGPFLLVSRIYITYRIVITHIMR